MFSIWFSLDIKIFLFYLEKKFNYIEYFKSEKKAL